MTTYRVTRVVDVTQTLDVEIDDEDMSTEQIVAAVDVAVDGHEDASPSLCNYCSDHLDAGDPQGIIAIYRGNEQIWSDLK